jgi:amidohydrolase
LATKSNNRKEEKMNHWLRIFVWILVILPSVGWAQTGGGSSLGPDIDRLAKEVESRVIEWRRDFHANPELGNREFRTSEKVAEHLRRLGMEVQTKVAHTGVVGILRGTKDTPVVALRADMDALPVTELADVPFASKNKGVMHACGHDAHTAILMGVAEVFSKLKDRIPGTVKFIFQPAEEGPPPGEEGGAYLMVKEGVLESPKVQAIFGLHVSPFAPVGIIAFRSGGMLASSDRFKVIVKGKGTHGAMPWAGVDPIVTASQIILGFQTIISRQTDLTVTPAVITVGTIKGGTRANVIPGEVEMEGTTRGFDPKIRGVIHEKMEKMAKSIAEAAGATAEATFYRGVPVTYNDPGLTAQMTPTLQRVAGPGKAVPAPQNTGAEDFAFFQEKIPGLFIILGTNPPGKTPVPNHSPHFTIDESALVIGVRAMSNLAMDFLEGKK